jgi:hypothetical protein
MKIFISLLLLILSVNSHSAVIICVDERSDDIYAISISRSPNTYSIGVYDQNRKINVFENGSFDVSEKHYNSTLKGSAFLVAKDGSYFTLRKNNGIFAVGNCELASL